MGVLLIYSGLILPLQTLVVIFYLIRYYIAILINFFKYDVVVLSEGPTELNYGLVYYDRFVRYVMVDKPRFLAFSIVYTSLARSIPKNINLWGYIFTKVIGCTRLGVDVSIEVSKAIVSMDPLLYSDKNIWSISILFYEVIRKINLVLVYRINLSEKFCGGRCIYVGRSEIILNMLGKLVFNTCVKYKVGEAHILKSKIEHPGIVVIPENNDGFTIATIKTPMSYQDVIVEDESLKDEFSFDKVGTKEVGSNFIDPKNFKMNPHDGSHLFLHDKELPVYVAPENVMVYREYEE